MLLAAMAEYGFAQCPKCKEATELKEGCKYVYCRCKTDGKKTAFCYHCGRQLYECVGASQPLSPAAAVLTGSVALQEAALLALHGGSRAVLGQDEGRALRRPVLGRGNRQRSILQTACLSQH